MTTRACAKAPLVEALRDGRLGPQESGSMERHLTTCEECAGWARELDRVGASLRAPRPPATPLQHQRARAALLERAALGAPVVALRPRRPMVFAFAAAAMMLAVAAGWAAGRFTAPGSAGPAAQAAAPPQTSIRPSRDASFERTGAGSVEVVTLNSGTLDVTVRPLAAHERFVVKTRDAEVEVRGTAFRVEAEGGRIRGVAVTEGTVEVRYAGFSAVIPSGGSWRATSDAPAGSAAPATAPTACAAPAANPPPPASAAAALPAEPAPLAAAPLTLPTPKVAARASSLQGRAAPRVAPEPATAPVAAPEPPVAAPEPPAAPRVNPASRAFAAAMSSLGRGAYADSAAQLEAFAAAHPADARADEAEYLRAIALQRAGRPADAAAAARRYLATRPGGAHRAEARQIAGD
jgi:hypothetical protein